MRKKFVVIEPIGSTGTGSEHGNLCNAEVFLISRYSVLNSFHNILQERVISYLPCATILITN
jgi:hypothetical protein